MVVSPLLKTTFRLPTSFNSNVPLMVNFTSVNKYPLTAVMVAV